VSEEPSPCFSPPEGGVRCGIDLVSVERIARLERELSSDALARLFGSDELRACRARRFPERHLATRFALKEACLKLFPGETASGELGVEDIAVVGGSSGEPRLAPGERLLRAMQKNGLAHIALATASCRTQACAIAVATALEPAAASREADLLRAVERVRALRPGLPGRALHRFLPIRRKVVLANMRRVFADRLSPPDYRRLSEAFASHMARFVLETAAYTFKSPERIARRVRVENMESPLRAAEAGRGLIILTGHFGNWEIACTAAILRFPQYRGKFHFLRRPISNRWIEGLVLRRFLRSGLGVVPKRNSLERILGLLERNEALVYILDQHACVPRDGIPVEFFGEPAGTFRSLALLARASGAPVIPAHGWREADGSHAMRFEEPLPWLHRDDPGEELHDNTLAYNRAVERMVLQHPEQWFWMHRRWKL
jgi:KDO2-lipid IV(A) lauroyltransferase